MQAGREGEPEWESQADGLSPEEHPQSTAVGDASVGPRGSEVTRALCVGPVN